MFCWFQARLPVLPTSVNTGERRCWTLVSGTYNVAILPSRARLADRRSSGRTTNSSTLVVRPVHDDLICAVCSDVLCDARSACAEGHVFYRECIDTWKSRSDSCPTRRAEP